MLLLLSACWFTKPDSSDPESDYTTWTYDSTPTIGPDDSDPGPAGAAVVAWAGRIDFGAEPVTGHMGFEFYPVNTASGNWDDQQVLCLSATGLLQEELEVPRCQQCAFSYTFRGTSEAIKEGTRCDRLIPTVTRVTPDPGVYEGLEIGVGTGDYSGMGRAALYMYMPDYAQYDWFVFTLDYPPIYRTAVDGDSLEWWRVLLDRNSGFPAYYYY